MLISCEDVLGNEDTSGPLSFHNALWLTSIFLTEYSSISFNTVFMEQFKSSSVSNSRTWSAKCLGRTGCVLICNALGLFFLFSI